jgi:hypothetical protein
MDNLTGIKLGNLGRTKVYISKYNFTDEANDNKYN